MINIKATLIARKAATLQSKGQNQEAMKLYATAVESGLDDAVSILRYTNLLIRNEEYQKARDLLIKIQKEPMTEDNRSVLLCNYATCVTKQGDLDKGIKVLESRHKAAPCGLIYQTLGYLYTLGDDFEKALQFNQEALEYDDEDAITLDNLAQTYYRLGNDPEKAKEYFEKAIALKPGQIDTLYFLAQYDIKEGKKDEAIRKLETALEGRFSPLNYAGKDKITGLLEQLKKEKNPK